MPKVAQFGTKRDGLSSGMSVTAEPNVQPPLRSPPPSAAANLMLDPRLVPRFVDFDRRAQTVIDIERPSRWMGITPMPRVSQGGGPTPLAVQWRQRREAFGVQSDSVQSVSFPSYPLAVEDALICAFGRGSFTGHGVRDSEHQRKFKLFYDVLDTVFQKGALDIGAQFGADGSLVRSMHYHRHRSNGDNDKDRLWTFEFDRYSHIPVSFPRSHTSPGKPLSLPASAPLSPAPTPSGLGVGESPSVVTSVPGSAPVVDEVQSKVPMPHTGHDAMTIMAVQHQTPSWQFTGRATSFEQIFGVDFSTKLTQKLAFGLEAYYSMASASPNVGLGFLYCSSGVQHDRNSLNYLSDPFGVAAPTVPTSREKFLKPSSRASWSVCACANALGSTLLSTTVDVPGIPRLFSGAVFSSRVIVDYPTWTSQVGIGALLRPPAWMSSFLHFVHARWDSAKGWGAFAGFQINSFVRFKIGAFIVPSDNHQPSPSLSPESGKTQTASSTSTPRTTLTATTVRRVSPEHTDLGSRHGRNRATSPAGSPGEPAIGPISGVQVRYSLILDINNPFAPAPAPVLNSTEPEIQFS